MVGIMANAKKNHKKDAKRKKHKKHASLRTFSSVSTSSSMTHRDEVPDENVKAEILRLLDSTGYTLELIAKGNKEALSYLKAYLFGDGPAADGLLEYLQDLDSDLENGAMKELEASVMAGHEDDSDRIIISIVYTTQREYQKWSDIGDPNATYTMHNAYQIRGARILSGKGMKMILVPFDEAEYLAWLKTSGLKHIANSTIPMWASMKAAEMDS
jgi:hypothetical protein